MHRAVIYGLAAVSLGMLLGCGGKPGVKAPPGQAPPPIPPEGVVTQGPNLVTNGDFSQREAADSTLPMGWKRLQGSQHTVALAPVSSGSTDLVCQISPDPKGRFWQVMTTELPFPEAPTTYVVTFAGRTLGKGSGRVSLYLRKGKEDYQRLGVFTFSSPEFKTYSFATSVPNEGGSALELWLGQGDYHDTGCVIQYDSVKVEQGEARPKPS